MTVLTDTQVITASGGLVELGYSQITGVVSITASSTDASPVTVIPALTVVCDGSPVLVEFFAPFWSNNSAGGYLNIGITQDGTLKNRWATNYAGATAAAGQTLQLRTTPTAGVHTFAVTANVNGNPAAGSINAGPYGAGSSTSPPAFLRVSKIVSATQWPAVTTGSIICTSSTRPASPFVGQQIYETDTQRNYQWNGTAWVSPQALSVPASVRAYRATDLTGYTSATSISFSAEAYDTDGMYPGTGTTITVQTSGIYMITFQGLWTATATVTQFEAIVSVGGNATLRLFQNSPATTAGRFNLSGIVSLTAANAITAQLSFVGGSAFVVNGGTDPRADTTSLSLTLIGKIS